jgi:WD40 repeat protein
MSVVIVTRPRPDDRVVGNQIVPNTVRVLDAEFRESLQIPVINAVDVLVSPNSDWIAVLTEFSVRLISFETGEIIYDREVIGESFDVSPDGLTIAVASYGGIVRLMDSATGDIREKFTIRQSCSYIKYFGDSLLATLSNRYSRQCLDDLMEYTRDGHRRSIANDVRSFSISNNKNAIAVIDSTGVSIIHAPLTTVSARSNVCGAVCVFSSDDSTLVLMNGRIIKILSSESLIELKIFRIRDGIQSALAYDHRLVMNCYGTFVVVDPVTKEQTTYDYGEGVIAMTTSPQFTILL